MNRETVADRAGSAPEPHDLVVHRAHVFDGHRVLDGLWDVAVDGGEVVALSGERLRGRREIDAAEGWVLPGLIDTHVHFYDPAAVTGPESMAQFEENELVPGLELFLEHGVTTIKSVGDPTDEILATRAAIAAASLRGPRLLTTGPGITGRDGHPAGTIFGHNPWARERFAGEVDDVRRMRDLVHSLADRKVDAIKLLSEGACTHTDPTPYVWHNPFFSDAVELHRLPTAVLRAGVETAHERGLRVTVHTAQQVAAREAVEAGADGLEHGVTVEPLTDHALIDLMLERGTMYTPTLWAHDASHPDTRANVKLVADAGVTIALGSDTFSGGGLFGANTLREAELMVAAGMTPTRSLVAATSAAARQCARHDLGVVAAGKRADLVVLAADPVEDIGNLRRIRATVLNGEVVAGDLAA